MSIHWPTPFLSGEEVYILSEIFKHYLREDASKNNPMVSWCLIKSHPPGSIWIPSKEHQDQLSHPPNNNVWIRILRVTKQVVKICQFSKLDENQGRVKSRRDDRVMHWTLFWLDEVAETNGEVCPEDCQKIWWRQKERQIPKIQFMNCWKKMTIRWSYK